MTSPPRRARKELVTPNDVGQRLDNFLIKNLKGLPRSAVYRLVRTGQVRVNGGRKKVTYRLSTGDEVRIPPVSAKPEAGNLASDDPKVAEVRRWILEERSELLVLNKPSGVAVHSGTGVTSGLIDRVKATPRWKTAQLGHRLDRSTSGCLFLGLKRDALIAFQRLLAEGKVTKRYFALVKGGPSEEKVVVNVPIKKQTEGHRKMWVNDKGQPATTIFRVIERVRGMTLVEADLLTGRTHQIRVHASASGWPIVGDDRYGDKATNAAAMEAGLDRLFLHCHRLEFDWANEPLIAHAPMPDNLRGFVDACPR